MAYRLKCAVINCLNNDRDNYDLSYFRFPQDKERCDKWIKFSGRTDLSDKSMKSLYNRRICSVHFTQSMFSSPYPLRRSLKRHAVPTMYDVKCQSYQGKVWISGGAPPPLHPIDKELIKVICEEEVHEEVLDSEAPVLQSELEPKKSDDHDYCTIDSGNNNIMLTTEETGSRGSTPRTIKKVIKYFEEREKRFDEKVDKVITILGDTHETLKETNHLIKQLIELIREK